MLDADLRYLAGKAHGAGQLILVPQGFKTDFASIPRVFWRVMLPSGLGREAAVVHDWMYWCGDRDKLVADAIFFEGLTALNVLKWRRWAMYLAVALFGGVAWRKHRRAGHCMMGFDRWDKVSLNN
jgi:hypothetical protein